MLSDFLFIIVELIIVAIAYIPYLFAIIWSIVDNVFWDDDDDDDWSERGNKK